jgi:hypothetical protein
MPIPGQLAKRDGRSSQLSSNDLIARLERATYKPRLSDDDLDRLRAHVEAAQVVLRDELSQVKRAQLKKLQAIIDYNDELRRATAGKAALAELKSGDRPPENGASEFSADAIVLLRKIDDFVERMTKKRAGTRGKPGTEKWRRAQRKMLDRLKRGRLPESLRRAAKAIEETYDTTRRAAFKSPSLVAHFGLQADKNAAGVAEGSFLEELAQQGDKRTRRHIEQMAPDQRAEAEAGLRQIPRENWPDLLRTMAFDPDAGSAGDVPLIEDTDQDSQADDCSE